MTNSSRTYDMWNRRKQIWQHCVKWQELMCSMCDFSPRMSKPAGVQPFLDKHHRTERVQCCHFIRLMIMKDDDDIMCNGQKGGLKYLPWCEMEPTERKRQFETARDLSHCVSCLSAGRLAHVTLMLSSSDVSRSTGARVRYRQITPRWSGRAGRFHPAKNP